MKTITLPLFAVLAFSFSVFTLNAQSSCPTVLNSSYRINSNPANPCSKTVSFNFSNPTSGAKRINVTVMVNNVEVLNECVDATGQINVVRSYTSASFTACDISTVKVAVTPYTGSSCSGSSCGATVLSIGGAPLPVLFSSFNATRNASSVILKWETATEINNAGFWVERNINGVWEQVSFVSTQAMDGNSSNNLRYQFTDNNSTKAVTQYRLKQTDRDGSFKYSDLRSVMGMGQDTKTVVFPNPSNDGKVTVVYADASPKNISITDMSGKTVKQWGAYAGSSLQVTNLTPGVYVVRTVNSSNNTVTIDKIAINGR